MALLCSLHKWQKVNRDYSIFWSILCILALSPIILSPFQRCFPFLKHAKLPPASGPLYLLVCLPGTLSITTSFIYLRLLTLEVLRQKLRPQKHCILIPTWRLSELLLSWFSQHLSQYIYSYLIVNSFVSPSRTGILWGQGLCFCLPLHCLHTTMYMHMQFPNKRMLHSSLMLTM